ncbi:hypothetical protein AB669_13720 [Pedobacter sp. BMA]|nr:hypothetical protein AB669_13720 [Pedobacter sp. BMA]
MCLLFACSKNQGTSSKIIQNVFYDKAFEFRDKQQSDSAYFYFNEAKEVFLKQNDSPKVGRCLVNMAIIATDKGDYFGGQELSLSAIPFFKKNNSKDSIQLSANFNNLGIATAHLKQHQNAIKFYDSAVQFSNDSTKRLVYLNNKANSYQEAGDYQNALNIYNQILKENWKDKLHYAMSLTNISNTKWQKDRLFNPVPDLLKSLDIRLRERDLWGMNSSYASLADYYAESNPVIAFSYAAKMLHVSKEAGSADDQLQALQKLIRLSPPKKMKQYFKTYESLNDSIQTARSAAKNQFALIRYDSEKNKSENLKLQKENADKEYQIARRELILAGVILLGIAGTIFIVFWYRKRKQTLALEAEKTIQENRLKTSKKVHDVVANGLYRVMTEIENQPEIDKESILDKIEYMYEKSRDISYDKSVPTPPTNLFHEQIGKMLHSFTSSSTTVRLHGNDSAFWKDVSLAAKQELEPVLQELMVNMKKHSKANIVELTFSRTTNEAKIKYQDNGIGFPDKVNFNNGLTSTGTRIENISGNITFENVDHAGLEIQISFPIHL